MKITCILRNEHRVIEQVLNCLERMADRCQFDHNLDNRQARAAIAFLRGFVEHCHNCKVEARLVPAIQALGVLAEQELRCPMHASRDISLSHLDAMEAVIEPACGGNLAGLNRFAEHARAYIGVLLDCIARREDYRLPLIDGTDGETDGTLLLVGRGAPSSATTTSLWTGATRSTTTGPRGGDARRQSGRSSG